MALHERTAPGRRIVLAGIVGMALMAGCTAYGTPAPAVGAPAATTAPAAAETAPPVPTATPRTGGGYGREYGGQATPEPSGSAEPSQGAGEEYPVGVATATGIGSFLTGEAGRTLYVLKQDSPGTSACTGGCASAWPPFTIGETEAVTPGAGISGTFDRIVRDDGTTQVTYNGAPLYYYSGDAKAGDTNGQGKGGVWFVAAP